MASTDYDERTGLVREQPFLASIGGIIEGAESEHWCLIAIDFDHFKLFNEWFGREEGDFLLAEVGARNTLNDSNVFPTEEMSLRFHIRTDGGNLVDLSVKSDAVDDESTDVLAILVFRAN